MRWKLKSIEEASVRTTAERTGLPRSVARALALRVSPDSADTFLNPKLANLSSPERLPDTDRAVERILAAISTREPIVVFGDYDVDGITASALLSRTLQRLGAKVAPFIPSRLDEGYGLSRDAVERCVADLSPGLVVTVDCGTNAHESVEFLRQLNVDVVVTDHHQPAERTAEPLALVNPKRGPRRDLDVLAGVGVAFKLAHALVAAARDRGLKDAQKIDLREELDLVALGSIADIVPLTGENRILVRHGLERMNRGARPGLSALKQVAGIRSNIDAYHVGFQLGPRINAAGRIGDPALALRLLLTEDPGEAREIAERLDLVNRERRKLEQETFERAAQEIETRFPDDPLPFGLVVSGKGWHAGVVGIVASRIARKYHRPAIVVGIDDDGRGHGSCRSIESFDLIAALDECRDCLEKYGGHPMAAGLSLPENRIDEFRRAFEAVAEKRLAGIDLSPVLEIDAELAPDQIDAELMRVLDRLAPFGAGNPEPIWMLRNACVESCRTVGERHAKLTLLAGKKRFDAIASNRLPKDLPDAPTVDVAFALKKNEWQGQVAPQLQIRDLRETTADDAD